MIAHAFEFWGAGLKDRDFSKSQREGVFMKAVRLSLVLCLVVLASSCALKPSWDVIGKWQKVDGIETLDFARNGTVTITVGSTAYTVPYMFSDTKHISVQVGSLGSTKVSVLVEGDIMTLTGPNGKVSKFEKVKAAAAESKGEA